MRICIISFFYRPVGGGIPRYIEETAKRFSEMGHKVDILTASYNNKETIEKEGNLSVYRLPCLEAISQNKEAEKNARKFLSFLRSYTKKKPDIFVAQNIHAKINVLGHTIATNIAAMEKDIPLVLTVHSFIQDDQYNLLKEMMLKNMLWDKIICVSSNLAESLFNRGLSANKISIIHPPINTSEFRPGLGKKWLRSRIGISEKDTLIVHAGRLENTKVAEEKGTFTLLKAISISKQKHYKVLIAAPVVAPMLQKTKEETIEKIKENAKLLGIEKDLIIQTFQPEEMPLVFNGADLFVLASQMETFGLVYGESLACGIPVIGTSVGGIPEVVENEKSGILISPNNPVELNSVLTKMLKSPEKMKKMGEYGRKKVNSNQEIGKIAKSLLGAYQSAINNKKTELTKIDQSDVYDDLLEKKEEDTWSLFRRIVKE